MEEGDEVLVGSEPGLVVDGLESCRSILVQGGADVGDPVADVVHARPASVEEAGDRGVGAGGGEQLDPPGPGPDESDLDALGRDGLPASGRGADERGPDRDRLVEGGYGDSDVVQVALCGRPGRGLQR